MIVTLTANPSLDRTLEIERLERGTVIRATASHVHPGGKGVNVARALAANGHAVRAVMPVGGREGEQLLDLLDGLGIEVVGVTITGAVRENVAIVEPGGTVTKVNAAGPRLDAPELAALVDATVETARGAEWVALCGALPAEAPPDLYRRLVERLRQTGARVAVDASGPALADALDAGPDVIKPNAEELAQAVGRPVVSLGDVVTAARELVDLGVGWAVVSLGRAGAVLVTPEAACHAWTRPVAARSNVGAGDATLAGFLAAGGSGAEALRTAVAWGAAAVRLPGTQMPGPGDIDLDEARVGEVDPQRPLDEGRRAG